MILSPKMAKRVSAPPENRARNPSTPPSRDWSSSCCTASKSTPGVGTCDPNRYRARTRSVKRILFRRSGTRNTFFKLESTWQLLGRRVSARLPVGEGVPLGGRTAVAEGRGQDLHGTARGGDGPFGAAREGVCLHPDGTGQLAPAEDLDQAVLVDEPGGPEALRRDLVAADGLEGVEVDHGVLDPERVLEALQLGDALLQGQLAALEADGHGVAGALALGAPAGGLAALAGGAAAR